MHIKDVQVIINDLPEGKKNSKLNDGETKKYIVGKIVFVNGKEFILLEIERDKKSLSMLLLNALDNINWTSIYSKLTAGLVNNNGAWD